MRSAGSGVWHRRPSDSGRRPAGTLPRDAASPTRSATHGAAIAARRAVGAHRQSTRSTRVAAAPPPPQLDPPRHYLEGAEEDVATYLLTLDTINFGSGWFPTLRKRRGHARATSRWRRALADRFRAHGAVDAGASCARCAPRRSPTCSASARDHELMALYAQALRALGALPRRPRRARRLVARGARLGRAARGRSSRPGWRCSPTAASTSARRSSPADLALAGVARFSDLDRLTIFADNLVPHVLRCDGVLRLRRRARRAHRRRAPAARRARRSARSAPAPCTPASCSPRGSASRRTSSTTGCGAAARRRSTRRARATAPHASSTEPPRRLSRRPGLGPRDRAQRRAPRRTRRRRSSP